MIKDNLKDMEETLDELASAEKDKEPALPESPASINIKFWADGYGTQLTMRDNDVSSLMGKFKYMLETIKKAGYKPKWDEGNGIQPVQTNGGAPVCGVHGTLMVWKTGKYKTETAYHKEGDPFAFWGCPTKNADGSYCTYKPPKEEKKWTSKTI
jgi:hypothetical protein